MLAANLAHSLARQGREVVLVSSDLRRPDLEKLLGLGQGPGLAESSRTTPSRPSPCWCRSTTTCWSCRPACRASTRASCWPPSAPGDHPDPAADGHHHPGHAGPALGRRHHPVQRGRRHPVRGQVGRDPDAVGAGHQRPAPRPDPPARRGPGRDQQPDLPLGGGRGDLRDQPDLELDELEPPAQPRQLQFNPRPCRRRPSPAATGAATAAATATTSTPARSPTSRPPSERNRRAAE